MTKPNAIDGLKPQTDEKRAKGCIIPPYVNGYPILANKRLQGGEFKILCYREKAPYQKFVVAKWSNNNPNEWYWGHYLETLAEAWEEYNK